jgi:YcxB-like protein
MLGMSKPSPFITVETTARFKDFITLELYYMCLFWVKWIGGFIVVLLFALFSLLIVFPLATALLQFQTPDLISESVMQYFTTFWNDLDKKLLTVAMMLPFFWAWQLYREWRLYRYDTQRLTVSEDGIRRQARVGTVNIDYHAPWKQILAFYKTPYHFIVLEETQFFIFPKVDITSPEDLKTLSDFICEQIKSVSRSHTETIT